MYFPDRGCVRTLRTLYVYATGADTASSRRFGTATIPYVARSTIGRLCDRYTLVRNIILAQKRGKKFAVR